MAIQNRRTLRKSKTYGMAIASLAVVFGCQARNPARPGTPSAPVSKEDTKTDGTLKDDLVARVGQIKPTPDSAIRLVRNRYSKGEVDSLCVAAIARAEAALDTVSKIEAKSRNFDNTVLAYEKILADLGDETGPLSFMGSVSTDDDTRAEGAGCDEKLGAAYTRIQTSRELYDAMKSQVGRTLAEVRLLKETLKGFELAGLGLPDDKLKQVKELQTLLTQKTAKYSSLLNNDVTSVEFTKEELAGATESFLARLKKTEDGSKFIVTTKSTDYVAVIENCTNEETRKKIQFAYLNRGGPETVKLLEEAVVLRQQIAKLLGYETWADYRTKSQMATESKTVWAFLNGLREKLSEGTQKDFAQLLKFKQELDPSATVLNQWDVAFMSNQLKKRDFSVDDEKVREYFPKDLVVAGMFSVYSDLLGVTYKEVPNATVWHETVKLYEIRDKADNRLIGFFYTDFIPRAGKYGHAAAFPLISGRILPDGYYSFPVAAIVSNFAPPSEGKPSLLTHDEVETLFHEFGHIMHQTLTRAPFASLSGSGVARDFVEAPSQMLENWVWQKDILTRISGHYTDPSQKLPTDLLEKMLKAKDFQQSYASTKQLLYGTFDMTIHTKQGAVDVTETYDGLYRDIMKQQPIAGGHFGGSFGHMMGGYDAGYYGYLWSKVYAQDMFTIFKATGITSSEVGARYRQIILERGNMQDAGVLLSDFLGRAPSNKAFYDDLHIQ